MNGINNYIQSSVGDKTQGYISLFRAATIAAIMSIQNPSSAQAQSCSFEVKSIELAHGNDINPINGDTNDTNLTGSLKTKIEGTLCDTPLIWSGSLDVWISGGANNVPDTERTDVLSISLGTKKQLEVLLRTSLSAEYGVGISAVGNFGGAELQNGIHELTGNTLETGVYSEVGNGVTPFVYGGIRGENTIGFDNPLIQSLTIFGEIAGKVPLLSRFGTTEIYAEGKVSVEMPYGINPYIGYRFGYIDFPHNSVIAARSRATDIDDYAIVGIKWDIPSLEGEPTGTSLDIKGKFGDVNGVRGNDSVVIEIGKKF